MKHEAHPAGPIERLTAPLRRFLHVGAAGGLVLLAGVSAAMRGRSHVARRGAATLALVGFLAGCGDVTILFAVRTGTVAADADCRGAGGSFDLRDAQGLTVAVILTDETNIFFASGGGADCSDITAGAFAEVRGDDRSGAIEARSVSLGPG